MGFHWLGLCGQVIDGDVEKVEHLALTFTCQPFSILITRLSANGSPLGRSM